MKQTIYTNTAHGRVFTSVRIDENGKGTWKFIPRDYRGSFTIEPSGGRLQCDSWARSRRAEHMPLLPDYDRDAIARANLEHKRKLDRDRVTAEWRTRSARHPSTDTITSGPLFGGPKQTTMFDQEDNTNGTNEFPLSR